MKQLGSLVLLRLLLQLRHIDVALGIHAHRHNRHARLQVTGAQKSVGLGR